jgi:hypothetical protein
MCEYNLMRLGSTKAATEVCSLSLWERAGVRGYGPSLGLTPSPGATRRLLPMGEVSSEVVAI